MFFGARKRDEWDDAMDAFARRPDRSEGTDRHLRHGDPEVAFERREFLEQRPWPIFRSQLNHRVERTETHSRLNLTLWFSGLGLATSVAVALLLLLGPSERLLLPSAEPGDGIRTKGGDGVGPVAPAPAAQLVVMVGDRRLGARATVAPDAILHFSVSSGAFDHVLVFGIEADGTVTPYYPDSDSGQSLWVGRATGRGLEDSVALDGRPIRERLIAVFSSAPLPWSVVRTAAARAFERAGRTLERMGPLGLPDTGESSVWLDKSPPVSE